MNDSCKIWQLTTVTDYTTYLCQSSFAWNLQKSWPTHIFCPWSLCTYQCIAPPLSGLNGPLLGALTQIYCPTMGHLTKAYRQTFNKGIGSHVKSSCSNWGLYMWGCIGGFVILSFPTIGRLRSGYIKSPL